MTRDTRRHADTRGMGSAVSTGVRQLWADPAAAQAQAIDKLAAARVWLLKEKPFFGVLARALVLEPSLATPAFRLTADDRLRFSPLFVLEVKFPALCARVAHVAMHAALGGLVRRGLREPLRWNAAHDLAIAPLLRDAGLLAGAAPSSIAHELGLRDGASADELYLALAEGSRPDEMWCDISDAPSDVAAPPAGTFTRQDDGDEDPGDEKGGSGPGEGDAGGAPGESASGDEHSDDRGDDRQDEGDGEQDDASGAPPPAPPEDAVPPVEARARELAWKMRLGAALEEEQASGGKTFGEVPAWLEEMVRATIEPAPDWSAILQRSISMLSRTDRSFLRPSRRMSALVGDDGLWPDVVAMPGRQVRPAGRLACVVDTSASIPAGTLARFFGALCAVATAEGFDEVRLVQADAEVTADETVAAAELLFREVGVVGRGGTDFGPALRMLAAEARREAERFTVVYLTDLDGRFPNASEVSPLDVLWVTPGKAQVAPPFGEVAEMALSSR
jgi:predicted metal-dependent peptidase